MNEEVKGNHLDRVRKHEQRLAQNVTRAFRQLGNVGKDHEKEEELHRSPFLDDEIQIEEEAKEDVGEAPTPRSEPQNGESEPTAEREHASGQGKSSAVARAARPCCDLKTKFRNMKDSAVSCTPHVRVVGSAAP